MSKHRHSLQVLRQAADAAVKVGAPLLGQAILPNSPMVGRLFGKMASEVFADHLHVDHDELPDTVLSLSGSDRPDSPQQQRLAEAAKKAQEEIDTAGGFGEIRLPKNFTMGELIDHECHQLAPPDVRFFQASLDALQRLRDAFGRPMRLTSAWRSLRHSVEARKPPDALHRHYHGAFDIACHGEDQRRLLELVVGGGIHTEGWSGIGIKAHGPMPGRFIHIDRIPNHGALWSYK